MRASRPGEQFSVLPVLSARNLPSRRSARARPLSASPRETAPARRRVPRPFALPYPRIAANHCPLFAVHTSQSRPAPGRLVERRRITLDVADTGQTPVLAA